MGVLAYEEHYTKHDYDRWEGDWELVEGKPYAMSPSPMFGHQFVNGKIYRQLDESLDDCPQCYAVSKTDLEFSEDTVVRPDSMVICYEPGERLDKAPELVFEVVSKSTARRDEKLKYALYEQEGVSYYAIVYPGIKKVKLYKLHEGRYIKQGDYSDESFTFCLSKCDISFDFGFIWRK